MVRNNYFDFLRGISILMVVAIHTYPINNGIVSQDLINIIARQIYNCAVPIFYTLSGFFLSQKDFSDFTKIRQFWRKHIAKVYIPTLFWSLPYLLLSLFKDNNSLYSFLNFFDCGYSIFYFIAALVQFYIMLPLLKNWVLKRPYLTLIISFLISLLSISLISYIFNVLGTEMSTLARLGHADVWLFYFCLGIYLRFNLRKFSFWKPVFLSMILLFLSVLETFYLFTFNNMGVGYKTTSFLFSSAIIFTIFSQDLEKKYKETFLLNSVIR